MHIFNIICGISSILGLLLSIFLAIRTSSIQKTINISLVNERFRIHYNDIMTSLKSTGMNAIRNDFPSPELIYEFETELRSYQNSYADILSDRENADIDEMLHLVLQNPIPKDDFFHQLSKITSKRPVSKEE